MPLSPAIRARAVQLLLGRMMSRVHKDLRFTDLPTRTEALRVETGAGPVTCTVFHPPTPTGTVAPVYVNFHGGGFVVARPEQDDHICRYIAATAGCVVINVDYAVAPQRPFPAPVTQAYDVTAWVAANGPAGGWDGARLAVGGHSAGANLTAAVCRLARDRGTFVPRLQTRLQIIDSAPLDQLADPATKQSLIPKPLLTPQLMRIFTAAYVPDPADRAHPLVSPALADDLAGLPPALVITAENDRLRDEGDAYAKALDAAGVPVTHRVFEGVDHYFTHTGPVAQGKEAIHLMATTLRSALSP